MTNTNSVRAAVTPEFVSRHAEESLIGGPMIDPKAMKRIKVPIAGADFADPMLGEVFDISRRFDSEGCHADPLIVAEEFERLGMDNNIIPYVQRIAQECPTSANVNAYAGVVLELSDARRYQHSLSKAMEELMINPRRVYEIAAAHKQRIAGLDLGLRKNEATLMNYAEVPITPIDWIWKDWLAAGKLHILGGAPGTGKTTLALAMAATLSNNGYWPDRTKAPVGDVIIWSGEDSPADTLAPRLIQSGADLRRVHHLTTVGQRGFDPATDIKALRAALRNLPEAKLLIIDPIVSAIATDSHKNAEVRRGLQPLTDLATEFGVALLGITHFTKGTTGRDPVERITGSIAFGAMARIVMVAVKPRKDGELRLLVRAKSNIGLDEGGFEYELRQSEVHGHPGVETSHVLWGQAVDGTAREILATAEDAPKAEVVQEDFGPRLMMDLKQYAKDNPASAYPTAELLAYLNSKYPWDTYSKGGPMTARHLSDLLRPFKITPSTIRTTDGKTAKGYQAQGFL